VPGVLLLEHNDDSQLVDELRSQLRAHVQAPEESSQRASRPKTSCSLRAWFVRFPSNLGKSWLQNPP